MKKNILTLVLISFLSCKKDETEKVVNKLQTEVKQKNTLETISKSSEIYSLNTKWQDSLIDDYVKNSKNELIQIHLKSKDKLEWFLDSSRENDSTTFYIYNIGIEVSEEDGSELRFSSCGWVYLDSIKRKLYEYDLPNDTIVEWKK